MIDFLKLPSPRATSSTKTLLDRNLADDRPRAPRVGRRTDRGPEGLRHVEHLSPSWPATPTAPRPLPPPKRGLYSRSTASPAHTYAPGLYSTAISTRYSSCQRPYHLQLRRPVRAFRADGPAARHFVRPAQSIPQYSPVETDLYNPCVPGSRLGVTADELNEVPPGIDGLHFHVLCESRPHHLRLALEAVEKHFGQYLDRIGWLNMGGGHLMTHAEYDCDELIALLREFKARHPRLRLILEPGSAFTWRTGCLVSTVEDIGRERRRAYRHARRVVRLPYARLPRNALQTGHRRARTNPPKARSAGAWAAPSLPCRRLLRRLGLRPRAESRRAHRLRRYDPLYRWPKTTMFNGVAHPARSSSPAATAAASDVVREFGYEDFRNRMS